MDCRLKINRIKNRCKQLRRLNGIPKKDLKWYQAKLKYPRLSPIGNADGDNHKNKKDCRPFDKKRHKEGYDIYYPGSYLVDSKTYKGYEIIRYGKELGLSPRETHEELKEKGYTGDEMRASQQAYSRSLQGESIGVYGG